MPGLHARLAPSGAHRWGPDGCPGSVAMEERHPPDEDSPESREGTAAHEVLAALLAGSTPAIGSLTSNGHPVTPEMIEGAADLVDDIRGTVAASSGGTVRVEERVDASATIHPDNWGTPDAYLVDRSRRALHVWDYKFGHKYVPVYRNWQLVDYAACVLECEGISHAEALGWVFTFTIHQPRCFYADGPTREWTVRGDELVPLFVRLAAAARAATAPDAPCVTGGHCYKCRAAWDCAAFAEAGGLSVDLAGLQAPLDMNAAARALWLRTLTAADDRLKSLIDANSEQVLGKLRNGETVPGCSIGYTSPREGWRPGVEQDVAAIGDAFGVELRKPGVPLVTPKQAVKMGIDREVIADYAETPAGTAKLVFTDDATAQRVFGSR